MSMRFAQEQSTHTAWIYWAEETRGKEWPRRPPSEETDRTRKLATLSPTYAPTRPRGFMAKPSIKTVARLWNIDPWRETRPFWGYLSPCRSLVLYLMPGVHRGSFFSKSARAFASVLGVTGKYSNSISKLNCIRSIHRDTANHCLFDGTNSNRGEVR